jgi:hypothetical protein
MPSNESAAATSGQEQPKGGAKDTQPERTAALISLYAAILANAASLGGRRQTTNDVFVGINIAVLSGRGPPATTSERETRSLFQSA